MTSTMIPATPATIALYCRAFILDSSDDSFLDSLRATTHDADDTSPTILADADDFADLCIAELRDDLDNAIAYFAHADATDSDIDRFTDDFLRLTRDADIFDHMRDAARTRLARLLA